MAAAISGWSPPSPSPRTHCRPGCSAATWSTPGRTGSGRCTPSPPGRRISPTR
ncbi:hypothetical protein ACFFX0_22425 [Citricoccus parietis]|uniref:Uncharacterized protein n=1 Tax=Citricoccus parietis TaxID=592307 RepID=A0ABV5G4F7_9MICC